MPRAEPRSESLIATTYTGSAAGGPLGSAVQISVPQDGVETLSVASVNTPMQKEADYLEAIRQGLVQPPAWVISTVYAKYVIRTNGANVYLCVVAGTSAGSGGPTGTGAGIVDNTCQWNFLSTLSALGFFNQATGAAAGIAAEGGPTGPGIIAIAGGGSPPARGAIYLPDASTPSAPITGDLWKDANFRLVVRTAGANWSFALSNETFQMLLDHAGQVPANANAHVFFATANSQTAMVAASAIGTTRRYMPQAGFVAGVYVALSAAPGGGGLDFEVGKNGSFSTLGSIAAGATTLSVTNNIGPTFAIGDYLEVRISAAAHTNGAVNAIATLFLVRSATGG